MTNEEKRYYTKYIRDAVKAGKTVREVLWDLEGQCSESYIRKHYRYVKEASK